MTAHSPTPEEVYEREAGMLHERLELAMQERDRLKAQCEALRKLLGTCREEFCWHGNTGKTLSPDIVDLIDEALKR